eukprot:4624910-Ditylum_brightwellii.AAC.1
MGIAAVSQVWSSNKMFWCRVDGRLSRCTQHHFMLCCVFEADNNKNNHHGKKQEEQRCKSPSNCKRNRADASIQLPMPDGKTHGTVSSSEIEGVSMDEMAMKGIVGTDDNPIDANPVKGGS